MLNELAQQIHRNAKDNGFYDEPSNIPTLLCLIHAEVSEALEADRQGIFSDLGSFNKCLSTSRIINQDPTYKGGITPERAYEVNFNRFIKGTFEEELADIVIRVLDLCAFKGIDIESHIKAKMRYNKNRPYKHGKKY